jgi:hypothetical protein
MFCKTRLFKIEYVYIFPGTILWGCANNPHPALYTKKYAQKARKNNF